MARDSNLLILTTQLLQRPLEVGHDRIDLAERTNGFTSRREVGSHVCERSECGVKRRSKSGRRITGEIAKRISVTIARKIDTFEISIEPYEDCCTVFTPKHPRTRPNIEQVLAAEAKLDEEALIARAVEGVRRVRID